eukprot:46665_1
MSQWRQKRKHPRNRKDVPTYNTNSNNEYHKTSSTPSNRNATYQNEQKQWHSSKGSLQLDFKHRSNRYQQYYGSQSHPSNNRSNDTNMTKKYYDYSSNNYKYKQQQQQQRRGRNYENNNNNNNKTARPKMNPKYLRCPTPCMSPIRASNLGYLRDLPYLMREKSFGMSVKCYITQNSVYLIDCGFNVRMLKDVFYGSHGFVSMKKPMLFDGELFVSEKDENLFYRITDCIAFEGQSVAHQASSERYRNVDTFMRMYGAKLREYAAKKSKMSKRKNELFNDQFDSFEEANLNIKRRLLAISTLLDHKYQHTKCIKNEILRLISTQSGPNDDHKTNENERKSSSNKSKSKRSAFFGHVLDDIQLSAVSVVFTKCKHFAVTKKNLQNLQQCMEYSEDSRNSSEIGYYYTNPQTGIKRKSEGILFIPQNQNYLMNRENSPTQKIWKPVHLLTVDIKIVKCNPNANANANDMDQFIDGDKLDMFVTNDDKDVWFNAIDMGRNDLNDGVTPTPFWNQWHLKQRSTLSSFLSQSPSTNNQLIVKCNYDFNAQSWSLFKLKLDAKKPSALKSAQDIISQMEEYLKITDLIHAVH